MTPGFNQNLPCGHIHVSQMRSELDLLQAEGTALVPKVAIGLRNCSLSETRYGAAWIRHIGYFHPFELPLSLRLKHPVR